MMAQKIVEQILKTKVRYQKQSIVLSLTLFILSDLNG